jgi:hypothetical protein
MWESVWKKIHVAKVYLKKNKKNKILFIYVVRSDLYICLHLLTAGEQVVLYNPLWRQAISSGDRSYSTYMRYKSKNYANKCTTDAN